MTMVSPRSHKDKTQSSKKKIALSRFGLFATLLVIAQAWSKWQQTSSSSSTGSSSPIRDILMDSNNAGLRVTLPRVLAIYFPQYHPDPLNDRNWGVNFTDWDSLKAAPAKNRYGSAIPRPTEFGYYDLRETSARKQQGQLARMHGIDGFVIHHYWFYDVTNPGPNLHAPLLEMLKDGEPDVPFFFNWCAERWTSVWMGRPLFQTNQTSKKRPITLQQQYFNATDEMIQEHFAWLKQFFLHKNYIRINGQPIFMVYKWQDEMVPILHKLRILAQQDGFPGLYILSGRSGSHADLYPIDTNALSKRMMGEIRRKTNPLDQFPMDIINKTVAYPFPLSWINTSLSLPDWCTRPRPQETSLIDGPIAKANKPISFASREIPGVVTCFDNTPRREFKNSIVWNPSESPDQVVERFSKSVLAALRFDACCLAHQNAEYAISQDRFVTVNAWNEWAEGMSLEPSDVYGRRLLQAIQNAKKQVVQEGCHPEVLLRSGT